MLQFVVKILIALAVGRFLLSWVYLEIAPILRRPSQSRDEIIISHNPPGTLCIDRGSVWNSIYCLFWNVIINILRY